MIARWEERYRAGGEHSRQPEPLVVLAAQLLPVGMAIDLACGAGRHALYLAERGWQVTAVDGAPAALDLFEAPGITKRCVDLEREAVSFQADLVVDTLYLDRALFARMRAEARAVALVLPMADDDPAVKPMNPAFLISEEELPQAFAGWTILHQAIRKAAGARRKLEFLATTPALARP